MDRQKEEIQGGAKQRRVGAEDAAVPKGSPGPPAGAWGPPGPLGPGAPGQNPKEPGSSEGLRQRQQHGAEQDQDAEGDWLDLYLKIALLWVDKPAFVKALISPDFKAKSNHPTILLVTVISITYAVAMTIFAVMFIASHPDQPWEYLPGCVGTAWLILAFVNPIYHIAKFQLWQQPMTVKARISAIPPPVRDQGDDHAKTVYSKLAYVGGSWYGAVGVFIFVMVGAPIADIMASLFIRDSLVSVVERWSANRTSFAQAEAVILGVFGTNVQFADNCSGDFVLRPSALRAFKWQDADIKNQIEQASKDVTIKFQIFDLDRLMPSIIERSGAAHMPISADLAELGFFKEGIRHITSEIKAKVKDES